MKKEDFKIELDKHVFTISSEQNPGKGGEKKDGKYTRREFNYRSFSRSFTLPADVVESDKIVAGYKGWNSADKGFQREPSEASVGKSIVVN